MNANEIKFDTERETDDDVYVWTTTATQGGLVAYGSGYSPERAMQRAIANLTRKAKELSPVSPQWENTPEADLSRQGWPGDGGGVDDLADCNANEAADYRNE